MQARMKNPAIILPDAMQALQALGKATAQGRRAACDHASSSTCAPARSTAAASASTCTRASCKKAGETDERLFAVAAWRETPYFTDAERAALALTEAVTRLGDRPDPVPDEIWDEAARHYDERGAGRPDPLDRPDQRLEPPQRRHPAGGRRGVELEQRGWRRPSRYHDGRPRSR